MNKDLAYLQHMLLAVEHIVSYSQNNKTYFMDSELVRDAVVRNFQIMGEACKKVSSKTVSDYPDVPWSKIAKFRDKLVHDYFGINYDLLWDVIEKELPKIEVQLVTIVAHFKKG